MVARVSTPSSPVRKIYKERGREGKREKEGERERGRESV
jgi:hypothetical protein